MFPKIEKLDLPARNLVGLIRLKKDEYSFWTKYKHFANNEILLYVIMVVGIIAGILIFG